MNKKNRKGFTIVELVIVIAVIGILATVLVPTFGDVIGNAKKSAAVQEAKNAYTNYSAGIDYSKESLVEDLYYKTTDGKYVVEFKNGGVSGEAKEIKEFTVEKYQLLEEGSDGYEVKCIGCVAEAGTADCGICGAAKKVTE